MRTVRVVVLDVLGEHGIQMAASEDERPVEALAPDGADLALADGVRPGCPDRALDDPGALCGEDGVEGSRELGVAIADEELRQGTTASLQQLRGQRPPTTQDVMRSWGAPNAGGTRAPSVLNVERVPEGSVEFGPLLDAKTAD